MLVETFATAGRSSPLPAKRMRMTTESRTDQQPSGQEAAERTTGWHFTRKKMNGKYKIHLKDPLGASYSRSGKETSWRCSSKTNNCPAVVRKKNKASNVYFEFEETHSCKTKSHGPDNVPPIPAEIQIRLSYKQEQLMTELGYDDKGLDVNSKQQQQQGSF